MRKYVWCLSVIAVLTGVAVFLAINKTRQAEPDGSVLRVPHELGASVKEGELLVHLSDAEVRPSRDAIVTALKVAPGPVQEGQVLFELDTLD